MSGNLSFIEPHRDSQRLLAISAVIALHAGVVYGLMHWGVHKEVKLELAPVQVTLVAEKAVDDSQNLQPPPPELTIPVVEIAPPVIDLQFAEAPTAITVAYRTESAPKSQVQVQTAALPKMVSTVQYVRPLRPRYPAISRRLQEEGTVVLLVLVSESGKASRIDVRNSSGFERLDRAAQEAAECALFKPYVEDGVARPALVLIPVEFTLSQRVAQR